jgi:hypothetical protein
MNTDPDPIRIQGLEEKIYSKKKLNFFWIKNYNLPIPRPPERTSKIQKSPQKRTSSTSKQEVS